MNKRILHLFNEAGFHFPEMERMGIEAEFNKFDELIVKECANIANAGIDPDEDYLIGNDILKHFGVE